MPQPLPQGLDAALVERTFGESFRRGRGYFRNGSVELLEVGERHATGRVTGSAPWPYETRVELGGGATPRLSGTCSCPMQRNCKHVAALALAWIDSAQPRRELEPHRRDPDAPFELAPGFDPWRAVTKPRGDAARAPRYEPLWFVLGVDEKLGDVTICAVACKPLKSGRQGKGRTVVVDERTTLERLGKYAPEDAAVLLTFARTINRRYEGDDVWLDADGEIEDHFETLLAQGRLRLDDTNGPILRLGEPRALALEWRLDADGGQRLWPTVGAGAAHVFGRAWGWYVDEADATLGRTTPGALAPHVDSLRHLPRLEAEHRESAQAALARLGVAKLVPKPAPIKTEVRRAHSLRARVTLGQPQVAMHIAEGLRFGAHARLEFLYEGAAVRGTDTRPSVRHSVGETVLIHPREPEFERTVGRLLGREGFRRAGYGHEAGVAEQWARPQPIKGDAVETWLRGFVERARAFDIDVDTDATFPVVLAERIDLGELELEEIESHWFEAKLGVLVDGQRVELLPILLAALRDPAATTGQGLRITLPDGRPGLVPSERLRAILALIDDLEQRGDRLGVPRERLAALEPPPDWRFVPGAKARAFLAELESFGGLESVAPPADFRAALRPYQLTGLAWLDFLRRFRFGGVLADDMGLGKTVQVLAHIARERAEGRLARPALVVCPTSVAPNWLAEAQRFAPALRVCLLSSGDRSDALGALATRDLVVTSYSLMLRDADALARQPWSLVVFDEAQWLKNRTSQSYKAAVRLDAAQRLCLTGTPVENHLGELKAQLDLVFPGLLGDDKTFAKRFRQPIERERDAAVAERLRRRLRPFLLRRTKGEVETELPPRTTITQPIELDAAQRDLYETLRVQMEKRVREALGARGLARSHITVLDALLKLRQVCCDPRLVDSNAARTVESSAKREALMDLLPTLIEDGRSVLLFSQFTSMLDLIEADLAKMQQPYLRLDGSTRDRKTPVERFQAGAVPLFLISLKAGGVGLNLTRADTVILYDPWWNPAVEAQAIDRAHRIGQDKPVFVYELVCAGTVEEKMQALKARKRSIADAVLAGDDAAIGKLDAEELLALFAGPT